MVEDEFIMAKFGQFDYLGMTRAYLEYQVDLATVIMGYRGSSRFALFLQQGSPLEQSGVFILVWLLGIFIRGLGLGPLQLGRVGIS